MKKNKFEEKIALLIKNGEVLFYNDEGNDRAYKLMVRHISSAVFFNYAKKVSKDTIEATKIIYIVDFKNNSIDKIDQKTKIKIIPLTEL